MAANNKATLPFSEHLKALSEHGQYMRHSTQSMSDILSFLIDAPSSIVQPNDGDQKQTEPLKVPASICIKSPKFDYPFR